MKTIKKILPYILCLTIIFTVAGCGKKTVGTNLPQPDEIVPAKSILTENLKDNGYTVTEKTAIEGSDLQIDRVIAEKGKKFIDITYGLNSEEASDVFEIYCDLYPDGYYILAQNGNYVYCVSDKKTFKKAGFTSTANIGIQYINE